MLKQKPDDDAAARMDRIVDAATLPMPSQLRRSVLAISLAEQLDSIKACEILKAMAGGATEAPETIAAQAALRRIKLKEDDTSTYQNGTANN